MRRKERIYKYECPDCGWIAYRAELIDGLMCSKCGCTEKPLVSTEERTYEISDDDYDKYEKAKSVVKQLQAGKDADSILSDIDGTEIPTGVERIWVKSLVGILSGDTISMHGILPPKKVY